MSDREISCGPIPQGSPLEKFRGDMERVVRTGVPVIPKGEGYQIMRAPDALEPGAVIVNRVNARTVENVGCFKP